MTPAELADLRRTLGLRQADMAERMGLGLRAYQGLEDDGRELLDRHERLALSVALDVALERRDPMLAPAAIRRKALDLADLVRNG